MRRVIAWTMVLAGIAGIAYEAARLDLNRRIGVGERSTQAALHIENGIGQARFARTELERTRRMLRLFPTNPDLYMIAAANLRILGRLEQAEQMYISAGRFARRPEIFLQLGHTQMELGKVDHAYRNYAIALRFSEAYGNEIRRHRAKAREQIENLPPVSQPQ